MAELISNNKRIAKNTIMLYFRMMINMVVSLYTSRVILQSLGVEDFGINNVVGGIVSSFSIFTSALAVSIVRFITYGLGKKDERELKGIFATSLFIQVCMIIVVVFVAESIGIWFLNSKLVIPDSRMFAANWLFQFSLLSFLFTIIGIPYTAAITAHEHMSVYAFIGLADTFIKLFIAISISYSPFDRLVWYGLFIMLSSIATQSLYALYCVWHFEECRCGCIPKKEKLQEMLSFSSWTFLGGIAPVIRDQGSNILLNLFFGPVVNAARGISNQVCVAVNSFATNFQAASNPQIIKNYASKDFESLRTLVIYSSKFSCFILLLLTIPISINIKYILSIWLGDYPDHTANFIQIVFVYILFEALSNALKTVAVAIGNMKAYQLRVAPLVIFNVPISYLLLKFGFAAEIVFFVNLGISILCVFVRLSFVNNYIEIGIKEFAQSVLLKIAIVAIVSYPIPVLVFRTLESSFLTLILTSFLSVLVTSFSVLYIGCSSAERIKIVSLLRNVIKRK